MTDPAPAAVSAAAVETLLHRAIDELERGNAAAAEPLAREALASAMALEAGATRSRLVSRAERALGTAARALGRYADAENAFRRGLDGARAGFGPISLEVAELENDLGMTWKYAGRFDEAALAYDRARVTLEALPDADPADIAALYHNLGGLAHARGDLEGAEPLARRAVAIRTAALGPDDPDTLLDRSAHAAILGDMGRTAEAEAEILAVLPALVAALGDDHPEVAVALNNLAAIEQALGRIEDAEPRYRRVVEIRQARLGPASPSLAVALNNHGTALVALGRREEARADFERALTVLEGAVEPDHPTLLAIRRNLAELDR